MMLKLTFIQYTVSAFLNRLIREAHTCLGPLFEAMHPKQQPTSHVTSWQLSGATIALFLAFVTDRDYSFWKSEKKKLA